MPGFRQDEIIAEIAGAGLGVICLPATDLYLMGRQDEINVRRGLTPVRRLLAAGVPVALASNNIRNPFTPVGTADLAHMAFIAAVAAHMGTPADLRALLDAITVAPGPSAAATGVWPDARVPRRSRGVGLRCARRTRSPRWRRAVLVIKAGRITIEASHTVVERWRPA